MQEGLLPKWDWETIPEYLDNLDRSPLGVNCIQYMPTASLMTYVMGLEAAKTRPATAEERKEMQRLLHEGMDAGLCGFSIQRLGPDSVQADFDGTPMVTDTMCDEDILALGAVLAERDEGFIQITQATGDIKADLAFVEKLAEVAQPPDPLQRDRAGPQGPQPPPSLAAVARPGACQGSADLRPDRDACAPASRSRSSTGTSTTPARRGATSPPARRRRSCAKMADPDLRADVLREAEEADRRLQVIQAGVGGSPDKLVVQGVNRQADLQVVRRTLAR